MVWDLTRYRLRSYAEQMRKQQEARRDSRRKKRFHLKRVRAEIAVVEGLGDSPDVCEACVVITDVFPNGVSLFTRDVFHAGQSVSFTMDTPTRFYARGRVLGCQRLPLGSPIIRTAPPYIYRTVIQFQFYDDEERAMVREYVRGYLPTLTFGET